MNLRNYLAPFCYHNFSDFNLTEYFCCDNYDKCLNRKNTIVLVNLFIGIIIIL